MRERSGNEDASLVVEAEDDDDDATPFVSTTLSSGMPFWNGWDILAVLIGLELLLWFFFGGGLEVSYLVVVVLLLTCECLCLENAGSVWSGAGSIRGESE